MKKVLPNNAKTAAYLKSLPKIYTVVRWARWTIEEFPFSKKFDDDYCPYVWQYDDHNGETDAFYLRPLYWTTTGEIACYTFNKKQAEKIAKDLNLEKEV